MLTPVCPTGSGIIALVFYLLPEGWVETSTVSGQFETARFIVSPVQPVYCALAFLHVLLLAFWLAILVHRARHTPGKTPEEAYKIPAYRLLLGDGEKEKFVFDADEAAILKPFTREDFPSHLTRVESADSEATLYMKRMRAASATIGGSATNRSNNLYATERLPKTPPYQMTNT